MKIIIMVFFNLMCFSKLFAQLNTCQPVEEMLQIMKVKYPQYTLVGGGAQKINDSTFFYEFWNLGGPPNDTLFGSIFYMAQNGIIISHSTTINKSLLLDFTQIIDKIATRDILPSNGCGISWRNKYANYCIKFKGGNMFELEEWKN